MSSSIPANNATNRFNNEIKRKKNTINNKITHLNSNGEGKTAFSMQRNRCILKMRNPPNTCILWDVWLKKCEICRHLFYDAFHFFKLHFSMTVFKQMLLLLLFLQMPVYSYFTRSLVLSWSTRLKNYGYHLIWKNKKVFYTFL